MTNSAEAAAIEAAIRAAGDPRRAVSERAYLKSDREFCGASAPAVRQIVRAWCAARPALDRESLLAVTTWLWDRPLFECRRAAVELLRARPRLLQPADTGLIEAMLRDSGTWALVDDLAGHVMGGLTEAYPELASVLDRWSRDPDFWLRRSAMLALLGPLRRGDGDFGRFSGYADAMPAERRPGLVAGWLAPRVHLASGVTVREAVKPLPPGVRDLLLAGYREKRPVTLPGTAPAPQSAAAPEHSRK